MPAVRKLLSCPACRRQYDATALAVGSKFRCRCGATIPVPEIVARDAAVVRCAACGASREEGAASCRYCGSDFTLHEQDLDTVCPSCLARVSNRSRFCHDCGAPILPEEDAGDATDRTCPVCGDGHSLHSRALGKEGVSVLECRRCAGLWLAETAFQLLRERARATSDPAPDPVVLRAESESRSNPVPARGRLYRPCPVCGTLMNRVNYGRRSGVLLDRCVTHGVWFDAAELDAALRWIRLGGERDTVERQERENRERASAERFRVEPKAPDDGWRGENGGVASDVVSWIVGRLFGI